MPVQLIGSSDKSKPFRTLFLIEMWERFGYYGMASLLVLFMIQQMGFEDTKANLTWGAFSALVYASPAIGGWLGDQILGPKRAMTFGAATLALGYACLSVPNDSSTMLFLSLGIIVVGNGLFKSNAANLVRSLFEGDNAQLDSAFTLYYMAVNIGSASSILFVPVIRAHLGWHAGFTICFIGMLTALTNYWHMRRLLSNVGSDLDRAKRPLRAPMLIVLGAMAMVGITFTVLRNDAIAKYGVLVAGILTAGVYSIVLYRSHGTEKPGLIVAGVLMIQTVLFFIFYQQMSTSLTLFALRNVTWNQYLLGIHLFDWQPAQYQALNPIWIMILSPLLALVYTWQAKRGAAWQIATKFACGFAVVAAGFLVFYASRWFAVDGKVSSWFMIFGYGLYSLGELLVSGLGLAMVARYVPIRVSGLMMGAYYVGTGVSQYLGSIVANTASTSNGAVGAQQSLVAYTNLFLVLSLVALGGTILSVAMLPLLHRLGTQHSAQAEGVKASMSTAAPIPSPSS